MPAHDLPRKGGLATLSRLPGPQAYIPLFGWYLPVKVDPVKVEPPDEAQLEAYYDADPLRSVGPQEGPRRAAKVLLPFCGLADADDAGIRKFCRDFGQLMVDAHGRRVQAPVTSWFKPSGKAAELVQKGDGQPLLQLPQRVWREATVWYREYARFLDLAFRAFEAAVQGYRLRPADLDIEQRWQERCLITLAPTFGLEAEEIVSDDARDWEHPAHGKWLAICVANWWLAAGDVRPLLGADRGHLVDTWSGGLWAAIGYELTTALRQASDVPRCKNCKRPVRHQRAPSSGRGPWCRRVGCRRAAYLEYKHKQKKQHG